MNDMFVRSHVMCICKLKDNISRTFFKCCKYAELKQAESEKQQIEIAAVPTPLAITKSSLNDEERRELPDKSNVSAFVYCGAAAQCGPWPHS